MGTKIKSTKPVQNRFEDEKATLPKNVHTLKVFYNRSKYLNKQSTLFWVSVVGIKMRRCFLVFSFILSPNSVGWLYVVSYLALEQITKKREIVSRMIKRIYQG